MANKPYPVPPELGVMDVVHRVVGVVRTDDGLSEALDEYLRHPEADNVRCRFLSKRRAYEVTLLFDAKALVLVGVPEKETP